MIWNFLFASVRNWMTFVMQVALVGQYCVLFLLSKSENPAYDEMYLICMEELLWK